MLKKRQTNSPSRMIPAVISRVRGVNQLLVDIFPVKIVNLLLIIFPFLIEAEWLLLTLTGEEIV